MGSLVFYDLPATVVPVQVSFTDSSGNPADPAVVQFLVTDPLGSQVSYTYSTGNMGTNVIIRNSTGNYTFNLMAAGDGQPSLPAGLWSGIWIATGITNGNSGGTSTVPTTWRILPYSDVPGASAIQFYTGAEELKSRLSILPGDPDYDTSDYEIALAIQTVTNWINNYCGRHFYQIQEARTFVPVSVWGVTIDDLVSTPGVVENTLVTLDYNGNGVYDVSWQFDVNYQLRLSGRGNLEDDYNINAGGIQRPYRHLQVLTGVAGDTAVPGGGYLPYIWPYSRLDRVKVTGTWGWNYVPPAVQQASMMLCVDLFKSKDAPWGVAGTAETGLIKVQSNPWCVELLKDYVNMRRKAGV